MSCCGGLDAQGAQRQRLQRLLLRLHDVRQLHVARLVQAQVRRHERRQVHLQRFQAGIDLAGHARLALRQLDLGGKGHLRPIPQRRQHRAGLAVVIVDRLLADDDQEGLLALDQLQQRSRGDQRLDDAVRLDVQGAVRAHRQRRAQLLLAVGRPDRRDDDFLGTTALLDPQALPRARSRRTG